MTRSHYAYWGGGGGGDGHKTMEIVYTCWRKTNNYELVITIMPYTHTQCIQRDFYGSFMSFEV